MCEQIKILINIFDSQNDNLVYEFVTSGVSMGGCILMNLLNRCQGFIQKVGSVTTINSPLLGGNYKKALEKDYTGAYNFSFYP